MTNGVDIETWEAAKESVQDDPAEAHVTVRTSHRWDAGFRISGATVEIEAAGEITPRTFEFSTDWPEDVGGKDSAPSPGEALLAALGGCVGLSYVANAINLGVEIDKLDINIEGKSDLQALFGGDRVSPSFSDVQVRVTVDSGADERTLLELGEAAARTSAVFQSLARPVPIELRVKTG